MAEPKLSIQGKEGAGRWENEADKVTASKMKPVYDSIEFTTGGVITDESLKDVRGAFAKFSRAHTVIIRTDKDITIKLNLATNDAITLTTAEGVLTLDIIEMTDIFISAPNNTAIKVILV